MVWAILYPCIGPRDSVFRISISRVPGNISSFSLGFRLSIGFLYLDELCNGTKACVNRFGKFFEGLGTPGHNRALIARADAAWGERLLRRCRSPDLAVTSFGRRGGP